jgi:hypothetical protein
VGLPALWSGTSVPQKISVTHCKLFLYRIHPFKEQWLTKREWWMARIRDWCLENNHVLHLSMRGEDVKIVIERGDHSVPARIAARGPNLDAALSDLIKQAFTPSGNEHHDPR